APTPARMLDVVVLGLSLSSSWGNGHATTYRALLGAMAARGHRILFLERDVPWYAENRDCPEPGFCELQLYSSLEELRNRHTERVRQANLVLVGSYVPEGVQVGEWVTATASGVTAFYDIDTPVTLSKLQRGDHEYLAPSVIPAYDLYLSFTGGPVLERLERVHGARRARPLYCAVDPERYRPLARAPRWDLGYLGPFSEDRQAPLAMLLLEPARRWTTGQFIVAGPKYPPELRWPDNVSRVEHMPPAGHPQFYAEQRFTLNVTREAMIAAGWSPSVRLFEAAACGTPVVSDWWEGLDDILVPGDEIIIARSSADVLSALRDIPDEERRAIGDRARNRILAAHTAA